LDGHALKRKMFWVQRCSTAIKKFNSECLTSLLIRLILWRHALLPVF
jgi:hypothetical protein